MSGRIVLIAAAVAAAVLVTDARAATRAVRTETGFQRVVAQMRSSGGTIVLRGGVYGKLTIGPRRGRWLTIRARPLATVRSLSLLRASRVRIVGLRVRPAGGLPGLLSVTGSSRVTLDGLRVSAAGTELSARLRLRVSDRVLVRRGRFAYCGERVTCILTGRSSRVWVVASTFRDCLGCDFIRGHIGEGFVVRGSTFDRAVPGPCGTAWECNHQDAIQVQSGRNLLIAGNRFGLVHVGAGQIYASGPIDGLTIRNNVFLGRDVAYPDVDGWAGIVIGHHGSDAVVPQSVRIIHNTVLTGATRPDGITNSVFMTPKLLELPVEERPVMANNVLGIVGTPERLCTLLGVSSRNVVREGVGCSEADAVADPGLDERGEPLEGSIVVDQGDPAWAWHVDLRGRPRDDLPDIGAFELPR